MEDLNETIEFKTVKEIKDNGMLVGYIADGMSVPIADGNRHYKQVQEWIKQGGEVEPQFTDEELAQQELARKVAEAKQYLDSTDHKIYPHYTPKDGENVEDIIAKRYEALTYIRTNKLEEGIQKASEDV